jgi:hypothetical protein
MKLVSRSEFARLGRAELEEQIQLRRGYLERLQGKVYSTGFEEEIEELLRRIGDSGVKASEPPILRVVGSKKR